MSAQAKTKKEYKKLMVEMLSSMDSESEDEKSSASSIKTVHLADNTTSVTITRTKKMMKKKEMNEEEQEIFSSVNSKYSLVRTVRFSASPTLTMPASVKIICRESTNSYGEGLLVLLDDLDR
ncbi:hypothetical protein Gohar_004144 [Gossypium harknessii]|uniref:Uncharacterized protein n=1 Tax=Gossypium harknessii TaxID=34285 RepID=A0A7J9H4M8_9ROSI|nr:hypothetical protein [Gossypium harknessii]